MLKLVYIVVISMNFVNACAVCYGAPDDPITQGLNKAIFFLLLTVFFILSCIIYGMFSIYKRSKNIKVEGV
tara:strand:+ start:191 stop:403 length:213 start_codon:yes stop_codon:yes gene_type:complete